MKKITRIKLGGGIVHVNCYLVESDSGFVLIDTGFTGTRRALLERLGTAGCRQGNLNLVVVTHGDFDHIGNCAYIRTAFTTRIAMHESDGGMAVRGDMFCNRKKPNVLMKMLAGLLFKLDSRDRFTPDIVLDEGEKLDAYGLDARVISIPGHSAGSIGILTSEGDLFCGDLLENMGKPKLASILDDKKTARGCVEKLRSLRIGRVYPGHGRPFTMDEFRGP